jgi:hypothetical protein
MTKVRYQSISNGILYASYNNKILFKEFNDNKWKVYLRLKSLRKINNFELYNRLLRDGIHQFNKSKDSVDVVILKGRIEFYLGGELLNVLKIENGARPLRNGIVYKDGFIIYSEYYGNPNRDPINVYKYDYHNDTKETIFVIKDIRHIHFIQQNIHCNSSVYIGTGDFDDECAIYKLDIENRSIEKIGGGSQIWRAVSILQKDDSIFWGTDDPDGEDYIVEYSLTNDKLKKLRKIDGPAYYSVISKNGEMYIATTIEDKTKHKSKIYKSMDGFNWNVYKQFKKDIFHAKYFGYGVIEFMKGQCNIEKLYYNKIGLKS